MSNQQTAAMLNQIEDIWRCLDELFAHIEATGKWDLVHGPDWHLSDVPYHLMYFDRDVVSIPLERGTNVPVDEQVVQHSMRELNEWNAQQFALRPSTMTPSEAVAAWQAMKVRVRKAINDLQDEQLMSPVWISLAGCGRVP